MIRERKNFRDLLRFAVVLCPYPTHTHTHSIVLYLLNLFAYDSLFFFFFFYDLPFRACTLQW
jgi:hypothetical protein